MEKMRGFPGDWTIIELQTNIQLEEAGGLELFDCVVATDKNNKPINVCKFRVLNPGNSPKDILLVKSGSAKPVGFGDPIFTDSVVIQNQFMGVDFYRKT